MSTLHVFASLVPRPHPYFISWLRDKNLGGAWGRGYSASARHAELGYVFACYLVYRKFEMSAFEYFTNIERPVFGDAQLFACKNCIGYCKGSMTGVGEGLGTRVV